MSAAKKTAAAVTPRADRPETWPVVWRVVIPRLAPFDRDAVLIETTDEAEAHEEYRRCRQVQYPVRLERVQAGPLPSNYREKIEEWRCACHQTGPMPSVFAVWHRERRP